MRGVKQGRGWRAVIAAAAAYALVLNLILAGLAGAGAVANAAGTSGDFELCLSHSGGSDPSSPAVPEKGAFHCVLCVTAQHAPVLQALSFTSVAFEASSAIVFPSGAASAPTALFRDPGRPPTGPPLTA
jgi:hypothetical protein